MMAIGISIVVPVFNVKPYLEECINSVLSQGVNDLEIVLVDDGSSDGSESLCDYYAEHNSEIVVVHQKNSGPSAARNVGLASATKEWVVFLDGDDVMNHDSLDSLASIAEKENAEVVCAGMYRFTEVNQLNNTLETVTREEINYSMHTGLEACIEMMYGRGAEVSGCAKLARRSLWLQFPFPEGKYYEDMYCVPQLVLHAKRVAMISQNYYGYRMRPGSTTAKSTATKGEIDDYIDAIQQVKQIPYSIGMENESKTLNNAVDAKCSFEVCRLYRLLSLSEEEWAIEYRKNALRYLRGKCISVIVDAKVPSVVKFRIGLLSVSPFLYLKLFYFFSKRKGKIFQ